MRHLTPTIAMALTLVATVASAQPNFSTSSATFEPARPVAGDVVRYTTTITNTGTASRASFVKTTLPPGFLIRAEGDCAKASRDPQDRSFTWHEGSFAAGATRRCVVELLTRRDAAGAFATVATAINTPPNSYHEVEARPELRSAPIRNVIRIGPVLVAPAGVAVMGVLAILFAGMPVVAMLARRAVRASSPNAKGGVGLALSSWTALVISISFLIFFVALGYGDWRAYSEYRETTCTIFGSTIQTFKSSKHTTGDPAHAPLFAVRYEADGKETYSSGYSTPSTVSRGSISRSRDVLDRYDMGSTHPCWYDPQDVKTVLLDRRPGGAYFFALLPLPVLALALVLLYATMRRPSRKKPLPAH